MKNKKFIVAVVGMPGAGKSSTCDFLKKKGFTILRFGDQTDIGVKEQGLSLTERNERKYREGLRKELGMAAYAIKIKPRIEKAQKENDKIALDGLYSWGEYIYLKRYFPNLVLLTIYSRPEIRYKRLSARKVRTLNKKEARKRDFAELVNSDKGGPIAIADYLIKNNTSLSYLYDELEKLLTLLK